MKIFSKQVKKYKKDIDHHFYYLVFKLIFIQSLSYYHSHYLLYYQIIIYILSLSQIKQMGTAPCNQCNNQPEYPLQDISIIKEPPSEQKVQQNNPNHEQIESQSMVQNKINRSKFQSSIIRGSKSFQNKNGINIKILNQKMNKQVIKIDLSQEDKGQNKLQKVYFQSPNNSQYYVIQAICGYYKDKEKKIKDGQCIQYIVYANAQKQSYSLIVFAGVYQQNKRQKGLQIRLKWTKKPQNQQIFQIILFKGIYLQNGDMIGLKKIVIANQYQCYWGTFNSQLQMKNQCVSLISVKALNYQYQYYLHQGFYENGIKSGKGILKIYLQNQYYFHPRNDTHNFKLKEFQIIQSQIQSSNVSQSFPQQIHKMIQEAGAYQPQILNIPEDKIQERIRYKGSWKEDKLKGFTIEETKFNTNFRYEGMYDNNQRNGYGEQYQYNQLVAKGHYKNGKMQKDDDNQYLYKGLRLVENKWTRAVKS